MTTRLERTSSLSKLLLPSLWIAVLAGPSPAFDIVAQARGRRSDRVLGMDRGQPLKAYKVHSTTRRQRPEKGSKGGLNGTVHGLFCWVLSAGLSVSERTICNCISDLISITYLKQEIL
jgi:hypothetical protein